MASTYKTVRGDFPRERRPVAATQERKHGPCVLVVDNRSDVVDAISQHLVSDSYSVYCADDGEQGLQLYNELRPDLLLLELNLPVIPGLDVFREVRRISDVPIIIITDRGTEADIVVGLELGADDYIIKPFSARELLARIGAVMRRSRCDCGSVRRLASRDFQHAITIDREHHQVRRGKDVLQLTATEFRVLSALASHPGQTLSRAQLLDLVAHDADIYDRTLDKHIANLRKKIETNPAYPRHLVTIFGIGYRFNP